MNGGTEEARQSPGAEVTGGCDTAAVNQTQPVSKCHLSSLSSHCSPNKQTVAKAATRPGGMVHICNLSTQEAEAGGLPPSSRPVWASISPARKHSNTVRQHSFCIVL